MQQFLKFRSSEDKGMSTEFKTLRECNPKRMLQIIYF